MTTRSSTPTPPVSIPTPAAAPRLARAFSAIAVAEAFSWAGLLVGMYLKHVAGTTELGVRIFGSVHGALFVAYVTLTLALVRTRWPLRWTGALALLAGVIPFATLAFERWASGQVRRTRGSRIA